MTVNPGLARRVLVVHGVQAGDADDLNQHVLIRDLIRDRLQAAVPLQFETELFNYEALNDARIAPFKLALNLVTDNLLARRILGTALDIAGDVLINLADGNAAAEIKGNLRRRIEEIFEDGNPLYLVAHSLGSIYAFDVLNELIATDGLFDRDNRKTWPVQGLVTIGSPIGLKLFGKETIEKFGPGRKLFRWSNFWDRTDPVVSGSFYGRPEEAYRIAERFADEAADPKCGWHIRDRVVDIGRAWLFAHVGYWREPGVGDDLVDLLTS